MHIIVIMHIQELILLYLRDIIIESEDIIMLKKVAQ